MSNNSFIEKHRAERFLEILENMLKIYPPEEYAPKVAAILDHSQKSPRDSAKFPPHVLLHSIEANCAYYRRYRQEKLNYKKIAAIMNHYHAYYDPVAKYYLQENSNGLHPFMANMAHQQFYCQIQPDLNDLGRSIFLFNSPQMAEIEKLFIEKFGINFQQWMFIGYMLWAVTVDKEFAFISPQQLVNNKSNFTSEDSIRNLFKLISITPDEIQETHRSVREKAGKFALLYETYFQSVFLNKPLLNLGNDRYLVVHKGLLLRKIESGIFDIAKVTFPNGVYGNAFGSAFEYYIGKLLNEFYPQQIIPESEMQRLTKGKVCDFIINENDYLFLIECKATAYSAVMVTENAAKNDNSTTKIADGVKQLISTVELIKSGVFREIIGDASAKKIIGTVVTFKKLNLANSDWYWNTIICNSFDPETGGKVKSLFDFTPQILSIAELEQFLLQSKQQEKTCYEIFQEKMGQPYTLVGDWTPYLNPEETRISLISDLFHCHFDESVKEIFPEADLTTLK